MFSARPEDGGTWPIPATDWRAGWRQSRISKGVNPSLTALTGCAAQRLDGHNWPAMLVEHACMGIGQVTAIAVRAVLLLSLSLGGCANSSSSLMDARAEAPSPQQKYLPVEDLPPKREKPAMTADEQAKLKKELTAARDRQAASAKAQGGAAPAKPMKPHPVQPTNQAVRQ
jgi:hypothetical protein